MPQQRADGSTVRTRNHSWLRIATLCGALAAMTLLAAHVHGTGQGAAERSSQLLAPEPDEPLLRAIAMRNVYARAPSQSSPSSRARSTARVRSLTPSLNMSEEAWFFTVPSAIPSASEISRFE